MQVVEALEAAQAADRTSEAVSETVAGVLSAVEASEVLEVSESTSEVVSAAADLVAAVDRQLWCKQEASRHRTQQSWLQ